jgi:hypothetical protein
MSADLEQLEADYRAAILEAYLAEQELTEKLRAQSAASLRATAAQRKVSEAFEALKTACLAPTERPSVAP